MISLKKFNVPDFFLNSTNGPRFTYAWPINEVFRLRKSYPEGYELNSGFETFRSQYTCFPNNEYFPELFRTTLNLTY